MNWKKLKDCKCPKCESYLEKNGLLFICSEPRCDFSISKSRLESLVASMTLQPSRTENTADRNRRWLNEL